jgi:hypothetical protein
MPGKMEAILKARAAPPIEPALLRSNALRNSVTAIALGGLASS